MPNETQKAVDWALQQTVDVNGVEYEVSGNTPALLVMKVREYFNENNIKYETYSYSDLKDYL